MESPVPFRTKVKARLVERESGRDCGRSPKLSLSIREEKRRRKVLDRESSRGISRKFSVSGTNRKRTGRFLVPLVPLILVVNNLK